MFPRIGRLTVLVMALALVAVACGDDDSTPSTTAAPATTVAPQALDIVETATAVGDFTTLLAAVEAAGLVDTLKGEGPFTVFAPTDAAFAALPAGTVEGLLADIPALTAVLLGHVVPGSVLAADVAGLSSATTAGGTEIPVTVENGEVFVGGARVVTTDIATSNGVIHVIESVILPAADGDDMGAMEMDIVETATAAGGFTTLLAAVEAAGLVETLQGEGPFTVFAPTDEAFAALPEGTIEALLADIPTLTDILLYHVVAGKVMEADVLGLTTATTVQGSDITIEIVDGVVILNGVATVAVTDIETSNGVIHVIDAVLLP